MYYLGMPFNEFSLISSSENVSSFFLKKEVESSTLFSNIYERIKDEKIVLVIYEISQITLVELARFHSEHYECERYCVLEKIKDKIHKVTQFRNGTIEKHEILTYDNLWRDSTIQMLDENQCLVEYRKISYDGDERAYAHERIFFADSWHVSEEFYD